MAKSPKTKDPATLPPPAEDGRYAFDLADVLDAVDNADPFPVRFRRDDPVIRFKPYIPMAQTVGLFEAEAKARGDQRKLHDVYRQFLRVAVWPDDTEHLDRILDNPDRPIPSFLLVEIVGHVVETLAKHPTKPGAASPGSDNNSA